MLEARGCESQWRIDAISCGDVHQIPGSLSDSAMTKAFDPRSFFPGSCSISGVVDMHCR